MASPSPLDGAVEVWRQRYDGEKFSGKTCCLRNMQRRQCYQALQALDDDGKLALAKEFFSDEQIAGLRAKSEAEILKSQQRSATKAAQDAAGAADPQQAGGQVAAGEKQRHFLEQVLFHEKPKVGPLSMLFGVVRIIPFGLTMLHGLLPLALFVYVLRFLVDPVAEVIHRLLHRAGEPNGAPDSSLPIYYRPSEVFQVVVSHFVVGLLGLELEIKGGENVCAARDGAFGKGRRLLGLYAHSSNADPFVLQGCTFGLMSWTWVAKKELFNLPGIGVFMTACGHLPIDRKNRAQAVRNLRLANESKKPPMVAPEGTRQVSGLIAPDLKKGAFHTQAEQNAVFIPIVLLGAYEHWPRKQFFCTMGKVVCCYLKPIDLGAAGISGMDQAREHVRQRLIEGAAQELEVDEDSCTLERVSSAFKLKLLFMWWPFFFLSQYMCWCMLTFLLSALRFAVPAGVF